MTLPKLADNISQELVSAAAMLVEARTKLVGVTLVSLIPYGTATCADLAINQIDKAVAQIENARDAWLAS